MKTRLKTVVASLLILSATGMFAQNNNAKQNTENVLGEKMGESRVLDGVYKEENTPFLRPMAYVNIREADVMWKKRIWRVIDLREKMNQNLYYPEQANANRRSLFYVIRDELLHSDEVKAYPFNIDLDDCFRMPPMTISEIQKQFSHPDSTQTENGNDTVIAEKVEPADIRQYMIKEDWLIDRQRSVMDVRILALCPMQKAINKNTGKEDETLAPEEMFWLYFPEWRNTFATIPLFNNHNDAERRTIDEVFAKRRFSSYIFQESDEPNRPIAAYEKGMDIILEANRIHDNMFGIEHDLWQY
jgi:gliding motility associated protien GldN